MTAQWGGTLPGPLLIILGGIAGLIAGSFIGALVHRWPRGEQVVRGRSRCDSCGHVLSPHELIPLVSFLIQRGRCRSCRAAIPPAHLTAEIAASIVGASAFAAAPPAQALAGLALGWTLVALALLDLENFWLPDRLTLPLLTAGIGTAGAGLSIRLADSLIGAVAGFVALALIAWVYRRVRGRSGMGGGDPKLLAAIGAWLGWTVLPLVLLLASLTGLAAIGMRALRGQAVSAADRLPLGTLLAVAAWPLWLIAAHAHRP